LLEVLISIFVLAVGLLSVAALIPAGRHEIAQGSRLEYASMIGRSAFRDLKIRGMLNPLAWQNAQGGTAIWDPMPPHLPFKYGPFNRTAHVGVVVDPLGAHAGYANDFPDVPPSAGLRLRRITMPAFAAREVADSVFRSNVDLITEENTNSNLPPLQYSFKDATGNAARRASDGNYTWLATIVSDQNTPALTTKLTVSVAVFYKRDLSSAGTGEYAVSVQPSSTTASGIGLGGGDVRLIGLAPNKSMRPGDWMMLAGRRTATKPPPSRVIDIYRWYRVVSAGNKNGNQQNVTLAGTDWDPTMLQGDTAAYLLDNIVAVYEKNMTLEVQ
jgi:hypothetical protein